jgi:hypothetical protein
MSFTHFISNVQTILRYISGINKPIHNAHYIDTFGLFEGRCVNVIPIQREQYGGTVHLFIGNHTASYDITFISSKITYKVYKCHRDNFVICT